MIVQLDADHRPSCFFKFETHLVTLELMTTMTGVKFGSGVCQNRRGGSFDGSS